MGLVETLHCAFNNVDTSLTSTENRQRQFMKALKSRRFGQDQANALTVVIFR